MLFCSLVASTLAGCSVLVPLLFSLAASSLNAAISFAPNGKPVSLGCSSRCIYIAANAHAGRLKFFIVNVFELSFYKWALPYHVANI